MPTYTFKCGKCGKKKDDFFKSVGAYNRISALTYICDCGEEQEYDSGKIFSSGNTIPLFGEGFTTPGIYNTEGVAKRNKEIKQKRKRKRG